MDKKIWFMMIFMVILSSLVMASDDELYFQAGSNIDLKLPCIYDNTVCDNTFSCNISITYPSGAEYVSDQVMTYNPSYFNYTLNETTTEGKYYSLMYCTDGTNNGYSTFFFNINKRGNDDEYNMIGLFIGFLILIVFFIVMGYVEEFWVMRWVSYSLAFIQLIFTVGVMYIDNVGGIISSLLKVNFYSMALIGFGLLMVKMFFNSIMLADPGNEGEEDKWNTGKSKWKR